MTTDQKQHFLFLTGKLAEKRLFNVLKSMQPTEFTYDIRNIGVSVAALMTGQMLSRRLSDLDGVDKVIVPGLCRGNLDEVSKKFAIPFERGPDDLKDLPQYFGRKGKKTDLSRYDVKIFAEITDAPLINIEEILNRARNYQQNGANVIDLGCLPDTDFPHLEESIQALKHEGFKVSIDSLEPQDLLKGGKAGADYLLSLNESSKWIASEVSSTPVIIPEPHTDMASLYRLIDEFSSQGRQFIADSILDPIHFGFMESLVRYYDLRSKYPDTEIMMGIGNLTELTEADTTGINALLFGIISELGIQNVLATEVSPHARSAVREADISRRIMFAARSEGSLPKDFDNALLTTHARKPFPYNKEEIQEMAADVRDPSYRVMVSDDGIFVYNRDGIHSEINPFELFPQLELIQDDAPHAFYMGVELARAQIAWQLGKRYQQDEELTWGAASKLLDNADKTAINKAAHALKTSSTEYKQEGSTLKASRNKKKKIKK